jgi:hypothetical protein
MTYPYLMHVLTPLSYWGTVLVLTVISLGAVAVTLRYPRRWLVALAAGALVVAVLMVAVPHPAASAGIASAVGVGALALSAAGGGPAVMLVLALASRGSVTEGSHGGILVDEAKQHEVLRGGTTIGVFERVATTAAIMAGFPEAVAVVVAIKGVGRFTELDAAEARERFIIGTLVSLVWACACAALFRLALGA